MKQLVSIIIPAYNMEKYLKDAVDSALAQTYKNIEVIVVDDGSTDGTKRILDSYIKSRKIRYVYQSNKGLSGARNTGIKAAKGNYIALLDADDIFLPKKIEKQVNYLENHPECDVCYCDIWHFFDGAGDKMYKMRFPCFFSGDQVFQGLLKGNFINPLAVVLRKKVFRGVGYFDEKLRYNEDLEFWLRASYKKINFCFQPVILAKYRMRPESLSYNLLGEVKRKAIAVEILEKFDAKLSDEEKVKYSFKKYLAGYHLRLAASYLIAKDRKSAARFFKKFFFDYWLYTPLFFCGFLITRILPAPASSFLVRSLQLWRRPLYASSPHKFIFRLRVWLVKHPFLRIFVRQFRIRIRQFPFVGRLWTSLERRLIFTYAEERYDANSLFSDEIYFENYALPVERSVYGRVLDLGCGYGYLTERLAKKDGVSEVIGIDKISGFRCLHPKIKYLSADIADLKELPGKFDTIVATELIEHLGADEFNKLLMLIKKSMAPNGLFIGSASNLEAPSGSPFHLKEYSRLELKSLLDEHFEIVTVRPVGPHCVIFKAWGPIRITRPAEKYSSNR